MRHFLFLVSALTLFHGCTERKADKPVLAFDSIPPAKAYRYVICTDMTHDDDNSLVRLLHYANELEIEAIIVTEQGPETQRIEDWPNKMWARAQSILDAYAEVEDNLRRYDPEYPSAEYFRNITKKGKGSFLKNKNGFTG